jgi:hypothetical protein
LLLPAQSTNEKIWVAPVLDPLQNLIELYSSLSHALKLGAEIELRAGKQNRLPWIYWRFDLVAHGGASMNFRNLSNRIVSSTLALGIVGGLAGLGAHSVSAQSMTVTTPFPYCVNNQAFPRGTYQFTHVSPWLLSIQDVKGGSEKLFLVRPEGGGPQGLASGPAESVGGATFRMIQGLRELKAVNEPGSNLTLELISQGTARDKSTTNGSLEPINCFSQKSSMRSKSTTGQ